MSSESSNEIKDVAQLPKGDVVSFQGDIFEIAEQFRGELAVYEVSNVNSLQKNVWLLSTRSAYNTPQFMQVLKEIERTEYKITRRVLTESKVIKTLYEKKVFVANQKATGDDSIVLGMFEMIINTGLVEGASDIHIEVRNMETTIRMRKDGEMMQFEQDRQLSAEEGNNLCAVMYNVLAENQDVAFDPRDCQQGAVSYSIKGQPLKLRYQSVPADPEGYDVILRILPVGRSEDFVPLQKLGYTQQQVDDLVNITSRPVGALIIAGVTGSGKSTTLKNLLMFINVSSGYRLKIYTIEDPPEYSIARVTQIPVVIGKDFDPTKMSPFEKPIKACMRGDPDIIMIGEVRDKITGDLTKKAVQSGHQVLTTVHATSALGILERFQDFGLSRGILGSPQFLNGLLYQKLMAIVCPDCSINLNELIKSEKANEDDLKLYKRIKGLVDPTQYNLRLRNNQGCASCGYRGIKGRTVCAEVVTIDIPFMKLVAEGNPIDLMIYWRSLSDGNPASENMKGKTCMEHAFQKMLAGLVCARQLEDSFLPINEMLLTQEVIDSSPYGKKSEDKKSADKKPESKKEEKSEWIDL